MNTINNTNMTTMEEVRRIIAEKVIANDTADVKRFLFGCIEFTTLKCTDSEQSVMAFVERVNKWDNERPDLPHPATICVYPCFAGIVNECLDVEGVEIACVSGSFPSSQTFLEVKIAETALAIKDGATEIDMVMPVGKLLAGDEEGVMDEIREMKAVCGSDVSLKVILETGCLKTPENIRKASFLAMNAGADYIKTSTGKEKISATPEAAYVMCQCIKEYFAQTGRKVGFKPAGGINSSMDAIIYYTIVKEVLGEEWLNNKLFRLGTSRLADILIEELS